MPLCAVTLVRSPFFLPLHSCIYSFCHTCLSVSQSVGPSRSYLDSMACLEVSDGEEQRTSRRSSRAVPRLSASAMAALRGSYISFENEDETSQWEAAKSMRALQQQRAASFAALAASIGPHGSGPFPASRLSERRRSSHLQGQPTSSDFGSVGERRGRNSPMHEVDEDFAREESAALAATLTAEEIIRERMVPDLKARACSVFSNVHFTYARLTCRCSA